MDLYEGISESPLTKERKELDAICEDYECRILEESDANSAA